MAHQAQRDFVTYLRNIFPDHFKNKKVLDIGSLDLNGSVKEFFYNCNYTGIDVNEGRNVDIVCQGQDFNDPDESFNVVCSLECFEHNPYWFETFENMIRLCESKGLVFFTCATTGREEHGTVNNKPEDSPLTLNLGWDYYKNLSYEDFISKMNFDDHFHIFNFYNNDEDYDLYFWGIKK